MTDKRPLLRASARFVNAICGFILIFSAASCTGKKQDASEVSDTTVRDTIELPVIWTTPPLVAAVRDVAITSGPTPLMLVALENEQVQLFNLDGDALIEPADLSLSAVSSGVITFFSGLDIVIYPALDTAGVPKLVSYSPDLSEPLSLGFPDREDPLAGLCARATPGRDALAQVAYWDNDTPNEVTIGEIYLDEDQILWRQTGTETTDGTQKSCFFLSSGALSLSSYETHLPLEYDGETVTVHLEDAQLNVSGIDGDNALSFRPGITVRAPERVTAFTGTPVVAVGSYHNGMLVVAGAPSSGEHRVAFVDPVLLLGRDEGS